MQEPTEVLVVDWRPHEFVATARRFPDSTFYLVKTLAEAQEYLSTARVLVTVGRDLTREVIEQMPALEWMHSLLTGVNWAVEALRDRPDVVLTTTRGIHGPQMTEAALCHMLCLARDVPRTVHAQDARRWDRWDPLVLTGRTVTIVGLGVIGEHLARACHALGMTVHGVSRAARSIDGVSRMFGRDEMTSAAAEADFLVLTVSLTPETERLIDASVLSAMKPTAYLVNLARGGVVDTDALVAALQAGAIAGAGLDVFDEEPLPDTSPLWSLPNVFLTAHMAGRSDRYIAAALTIFEPNLRHFLAGDRSKLINVVPR